MRSCNLLVETLETNLKKSVVILQDLLAKYVKLKLVDDAEDDNDEAGGAADDEAPTTVVRQIDQIVWKTGKGNGYTAVACDVKANDTIDRTVRTEYTVKSRCSSAFRGPTTKATTRGSAS